MPESTEGISEHDMELAPSFAERMRRERSICWDQDILDRAEREIKATQKFLVPSEFVSRSLAYSGVKSEQLLRCPYGVDIAQFSPKEYKDDLYIKNRAMPYRQAAKLFAQKYTWEAYYKKVKEIFENEICSD